jgi:cytoskeleton protein RodZ
VLALLPPAGGQRLEQVGSGLNAPFRDRPGRMAPNEWAILGNPTLWIAALLVIGALVVYVMPARWLPAAARNAIGAGAGGAASAPATAASSSTTISETIVVSPTGSGAASAAADAFPPEPASAPATTSAATVAPAQPAVNATAAEPTAVTGVLQLRPSAQSWIEVTDARGAALISRLVEPGEAVELDGTPPFRLKIGNAEATQVVFRGKPVDLTRYVRDNVARFELK